MKRMQLVELEDLPWFPAILRDGGTAYIELVGRKAGHSAMLAPTLGRALKQSGASRIVDLCSGGGGPVRCISEALHAQGQPVQVLLSDLYPNRGSLDHVAATSAGRVQVHPQPVDATAVPPELDGFRTLFNAFHHFPPEAARAILADAVHKRRPIGVFEVVSREPLTLIGILMAPLIITLSLPFWRPFKWQWILWTWLIPLMQPFVVWDGVVSWLRVYSVEELRELVAGIEAPDWEWEIGTIKLGEAPAHATYLLGRPVEPAAA